jgi:putative transcriptional regulator
MEDLRLRIAGEIAMSEFPGDTIRKWRDIFGIPQIAIAEYLKISPSTVSDYEASRRKSPGIVVIKRFVDALIQLDIQRGGQVVKKFKEYDIGNVFFQSYDFQKQMTVEDFAKAINAKFLTGEQGKNRLVFGCTILDSIKIILELPYESFMKIYSTTSQRALLFTHVESGRSPMVAVRVSPIKPVVVVLHGVTKVDKLAVKIAESEGIPLLLTNEDLNVLNESLKKVSQ